MRFILTLLMTFSLLHSGGLLKVEWPKPTKQHQKSMRAYPKALKDRIKDVRLPVYLPKSYIYEKGMLIVSDKGFYTATIPIRGATLMITGDRTYQQIVKSNNRQFKAKLEIIDRKFVHAEGMISTNFNRHGVNYSLVLECDSPNKDKRCKENIFLKKIYKELVIIGGKR